MAVLMSEKGCVRSLVLATNMQAGNREYFPETFLGCSRIERVLAVVKVFKKIGSHLRC
jgi:hypothetical protein